MRQLEIRRAAVAGQFYSASAQRLKQEIKGLIEENACPEEVKAALLPHAGFMYSGKVAARTVSHIKIKENLILIGPNHTGFGTPFSIMTEGLWQSPLAEVQINSKLANSILDKSKYLERDSLAHLHEHCLEVELPLFQYYKSDFQIIPIVVTTEKILTYKEIACAIANAVEEQNIKDSVVIIASSDLTHYEPQAQAQKKDKYAIEAILELNETKLIEMVEKFNISMCGWAAVVIMLLAAKLLGASKAQLLNYATSGDVSGEYGSVVGYAGIVIN